MARQLVSHGHVSVNGRRVTIPSYEVKPGDTLSLSAVSREIPDVRDNLESASPPPAWLERQGAEGRVSSLPAPEDIEPIVEPQRIVEFYSR